MSPDPSHLRHTVVSPHDEPRRDHERGRTMRDEHTVICSPAVFELTSAEASAVPVKVDLTYHSRDPYAVRASFRTGSSSVEWVFARDLLHGGLVGPAGAGDVRVQPMPGDPDEGPAGALFAVRSRSLHDLRDDPRRLPVPHLRGRPRGLGVLVARLRHGALRAAQRVRTRLIGRSTACRGAVWRLWQVWVKVAPPRSGDAAHADVAQLVAHHLAKVRVAGSNPVVRSELHSRTSNCRRSGRVA